jgi:hypothetical protein
MLEEVEPFAMMVVVRRRVTPTDSQVVATSRSSPLDGRSPSDLRAK